MLRVIKAAQRLGFTLDEVADLLDARPTPATARASTPACSSAPRAKLAEVEERITDLTTIRDTLRAALDAGCDDLSPAPAATAAPSRSRPSPSARTAPWQVSTRDRAGCGDRHLVGGAARRLRGVLRRPAHRGSLGVAGSAATAVTLAFAGAVLRGRRRRSPPWPRSWLAARGRAGQLRRPTAPPRCGAGRARAGSHDRRH